MRFSRTLIFAITSYLLLLFGLPSLAYAQADISAQVLLSPSSQSETPQEAGLESGRYQIKDPDSEDLSLREPAQEDGMQIRLKKNSEKTTTATLPKKKTVTKLPAKKVQNQPLQNSLQMQTSVVVTPQPAPLKPTPEKDSALAQSLFSPTATPRPNSVVSTTTTRPAVTTTSSTSTTLPVKTVVAMPSDESAPATKSQTNVAPVIANEVAAKEAPAVAAETSVSTTAETTPATVATEPVLEEQPASFDQTALQAYKERIHSDDIRLNQIEVSIMPGVINNDSRADYSYRNYSSFSPAVQFGGELWMSPFLGVYGNYMTSLGADIVSNGAQNARTPAKHEWTELGLDIRKFFGMSRRASSIEFGVLYSEYKFSVPGDEMNRVDTKTAGFGFHFSTRIPVAPTYAWTFGTEISPRLGHSEKATGLNLETGSSPESSRIGFDVGGEFKMARENQIIWNLNVAFEKNQYVGPANQPDPLTGITPSGVSIRNTFTGFSLGYRWGQ